MWKFRIFAIISPDFGCTHSGFLTVWIASGEKKFRLFLFLLCGQYKFSQSHNILLEIIANFVDYKDKMILS